jgi:hypothetical protein
LCRPSAEDKAAELSRREATTEDLEKRAAEEQARAEAEATEARVANVALREQEKVLTQRAAAVVAVGPEV